MEQTKLIVEILFYIISSIAFIITVFTYTNSIKIKKAEWLSSLSEKFYQNNHYKDIRRILDYPEKNPDFDKLKLAINRVINNEYILDSKEISLLEEFVNFLNFFELMGTLEQLGQLKYNEIRLMFDYYLQLLKSMDNVESFLKHEGFKFTLSLTNRKI